MDATQVDGVIRVLGIALEISKPIQIVALIALCVFILATIWMFTRVGSASHDIKRLEQAMKMQNVEVATQIGGRYGVNLDTLSPEQKFVFAMEQVKGNKFRLLILTGATLFALIALIVFFIWIATPAQAKVEDPVKLLLVLKEIPDPARRLEVYKLHCQCDPPEHYILVIRSLQPAPKSPELSPDREAVPNRVITAVSRARTSGDVQEALATYEVTACKSQFEFKVVNARLVCADGTPIPFLPLPRDTGDLASLRALVFHFTGAPSIRGVINWITRPDSTGAVHILISRSGAVVQFAGLDKRTWHAGLSRWQDLTGLNAYSVGISYDNSGQVNRNSEGKFIAFGRELPASDVLCTTAGQSETCWQRYTAVQIAVTRGLIKAIFAQSGKLPLLGHFDITEHRTDPGPAFPLQDLRREFGVENMPAS